MHPVWFKWIHESLQDYEGPNSESKYLFYGEQFWKLLVEENGNSFKK